MNVTDQAAATFARIVKLQDENAAMADLIGKLLDEEGRLRQENAALKRILAACHLDKTQVQSHCDGTGAT
jgi:regulator of replication initiation timing